MLQHLTALPMSRWCLFWAFEHVSTVLAANWPCWSNATAGSRWSGVLFILRVDESTPTTPTCHMRASFHTLLMQASLVSSPNFQEFIVELEPKSPHSDAVFIRGVLLLQLDAWNCRPRYEPINNPLLYLSIFLAVAWEINWEQSSFAISPVLYCL